MLHCLFSINDFKYILEKVHSKEDSGVNAQADSKLDFAEKLAEFINSEIVYSIRRIMNAELKHLYVGPLMKGK